jgi:hypothetical protein
LPVTNADVHAPIYPSYQRILEETGESWREIAEIDVTCVIDRARTRALAQERARDLSSDIVAQPPDVLCSVVTEYP